MSDEIEVGQIETLPRTELPYLTINALVEAIARRVQEVGDLPLGNLRSAGPDPDLSRDMRASRGNVIAAIIREEFLLGDDFDSCSLRRVENR